jgi:NAD(P)-dependent dehydrogenase (short-subunit alcohol dehydrogenase family)
VGGGSIINISSIYGIIGSPTSTAYHAAKGASRLFTKSAAMQYAKDNIRVNSVHPGYALTPLTRDGFESDTDRRQWTLDRIPMGRYGNAYDIAYGILYLASDESSYVTGSELVIDGGTTAQ